MTGARRNEWVFSSSATASGRLTDPSIAHRKACAIAGLDLTLHGLRRSFASLCEWIEMPAGIAVQIQGHKPQGVCESKTTYAARLICCGCGMSRLKSGYWSRPELIFRLIRPVCE